KMKLDDCLVLNTQNKICDSSIANVFCVKNETIFTPSLSQGCIAGVMRLYLVTSLKLAGIDVVERDIDVSFVADADEIFLTNAIRGLFCVTQFESKTYGNKTGREIFTRILGNPVRNFNI
ncbi:MAG TPA: aminotransferase class IV, partial [Puia sp.]|nr:aminotransferase class IV [Puia sp.]